MHLINMNNDDLVLRQKLLLVRSTELRFTLFSQARVFKRPLTVADQALAALQWLYRNPQWPLGALLALVALRPRRSILLGTRLWWAWRAFNRARIWMASTSRQRLLP